ncbi:MAG: hypothetical protein EZS28_046141 [Streblomastix strix]|uniref:Reverse transcriptase RNase H-like domain-containing protein n=1 Tax=Streblomastix strix TaxID=222440 RepID=A0A5J4TKA9_9EUKA|nr:MAG: hypothetical protein EZS28_046141 [Streblomastix strix]
MDMEFERNEYMNVRGKKVENDTNIEGLVQRNIQEQKHKDKTTSNTDRQIELLQTPDKRSISIPNGIGHSKNARIENEVIGWDNESKQNSNQKVETMDKEKRGWGATVIYENQIELIQRDYWSEKKAKLTSSAKEIKAIYYGLLRFEQVFKKMRDQAVLIHSDYTTAVYDIGKWKAKECLIERIKQVFYLVKRLQQQITTIHIQGKLNSTIDSLSRLCRSGATQ